MTHEEDPRLIEIQTKRQRGEVREALTQLEELLKQITLNLTED